MCVASSFMQRVFVTFEQVQLFLLRLLHLQAGSGCGPHLQLTTKPCLTSNSQPLHVSSTSCPRYCSHRCSHCPPLPPPVRALEAAPQDMHTHQKIVSPPPPPHTHTRLTHAGHVPRLQRARPHPAHTRRPGQRQRRPLKACAPPSTLKLNPKPLKACAVPRCSGAAGGGGDGLVDAVEMIYEGNFTCNRRR